MNRSWKAFIGTDNRIILSQADVLLPNDYSAGGVFNPLGSGEEVFVSGSEPFYEASVFVRNTIRWPESRWTFSPSGRLDHFSATGDLFVDPRLAVTYDASTSLRLKASGGKYHQAPEPRETSEDVGNPDLATPSAWHLAVGADHDFRRGSSRGLTLSEGLFFRWFDNLVVRSNEIVTSDGLSRPEYFNSLGSGTSFGGETTARWNFDPWDLTAAYTLLRSRRTEPGVGTYPAQFDQTHNLNLLAGVNLPRNWRLSTRFRFVTGNPYTPIVASSYDTDNGVYIPQRGAYYSERLDPFFQWDFRVDKRWIFQSWILSLYLDVQNVTNRGNPEGIQYAYDYSSFTTINGLPVIPSLGLKGEF